MKFLTLLFNACLSDRAPATIGWALLPAFSLGVFPITSVQWITSLVATLFLRVNIIALLVFTLFFHMSTGYLDTFAHSVGEAVLLGGPRPLWARLYHAPLVPYTEFNHSVVMGYLIFWVAIIPLCFFTTQLVEARGGAILKKFYMTDLCQSFTSSRLYRRFAQYLRYENK